MAALEGIEKFLFKEGIKIKDLKVDLIKVVRGDVDFPQYMAEQLEYIGQWIEEPFGENEWDIWGQYMNIAEYMNNKRIQENVPDDFCDNPTEEHKLLRELPFELAGYEEIYNYYTFMNPFIERFFLPKLGSVGSIEKYGGYKGFFAPDSKEYNFYPVRIIDFMENNNIRNKDDLRDYLKNIGDRFEPLNPENAPKGKKKLAEERVKLLTDDKTVDQVMEILLRKNEYIQQVFDEFEAIENL